MSFWGVIKADLRRMIAIEKPGLTNVGAKHLLIAFLTPRFRPVFLIRQAAWFQQHGLKPLAKLAMMRNMRRYGIEVTPRCSIGPGLYLPHTYGTVIGAYSIGANAVIYQGVTFGAKELTFEFSEGNRPKIGDNVLIGAGAKILGGIEIGDNVQVGANSVVVHSVPSDCRVAGVPAKSLS